MSRRLDRALEAIDGGLQRSDEHSYGSDRPDRCWRCLEQPVERGSGSELCPGCRAHLLGDRPDLPEEDPVTAPHETLFPAAGDALSALVLLAMAEPDPTSEESGPDL